MLNKHINIFFMIIKKGSKGEEVKKIQEKLGLSSDGDFGQKTEDAVKAFQSKHGLTADGIVGPTTWEKIVNLVSETLQVAPQVGGLNLQKLKGHIPDSVIAQIPETAAKFKIDTPLKLAHFLAQCGHESAGFKVVNENLNYSSDGLKKIFPKYFPGNLSESYARNPEKIAAKVYGGRMGNGVESTKEGWKFRGRGYIQLTGKDNYTAFGKAINEDIVSNPDLVSTKYPLLSAAWFFSKNCLGRCVDASDATVTSVTKCVNGGTIGLPDRLKHFKEYYHLLS
jgi:putative chitinase